LSPGLSPLWLALAWLAYAALHSLLAAPGIKAACARRWPHWMPAYRLGFNLIALLSLLPVLGVAALTERTPLWQWHGFLQYLAWGLSLAALIGLRYSSRAYDLREFLGLTQWRLRRSDGDHAAFSLSPLHHLVRHPWYALCLLLIWTQNMDSARLTSALAITLYFIIGSRLEERQLLMRHGDRYRRYQAAVPALLPRPWRYLSREKARQLLAS
jgi:protein-S-isoprenylcysteine O-methyltransferase Ste14